MPPRPAPAWRGEAQRGMGDNVPNTPTSDELGDAPEWFSPLHAMEWGRCRSVWWWLKASDAALLEIIVLHRVNLMTDPMRITTAATGLYLKMLTQIGATPITRANVDVREAPADTAAPNRFTS